VPQGKRQHRDEHHSTDAGKRWIAIVALIVSLVLLVIEFWKAPIVMLISGLAMTVVVWRSQKGVARPRRREDPVVNRETQLGALLLCGLWLGVFVVFWLADSNVDSALRAAVPVRFDGETVTAGLLLVHGLLSTAAAALFSSVFGVKRLKRRRHHRSSVTGERI
jgi:hypothetical protein